MSTDSVTMPKQTKIKAKLIYIYIVVTETSNKHLHNPHSVFLTKSKKNQQVSESTDWPTW